MGSTAKAILVPEMEVEVASTVKAMEDKDPVPEVELVSTVKAMEDKDPVKAVENMDPAKADAVTTIRSCLEIVPTIRNDWWGRPLSFQR